MSVRWERFSGDTSTFAIKVAFHADPDGGRGADIDTAASWGAFQLWVDGVNLCTHVDQGETLQSAHWYLLPILEWLAESWDPLLHEERLPSSSSRFETAADLAAAVPSFLFTGDAASIGLANDERRFEWELRHSIRAAREGGILPDVRLRRFRDALEVSWNNTPLAGAAGAEFVATQGRSLQEPGQVAGALHEVLHASATWLQTQRPESTRVRELVSMVDQLSLPSRTEERTAWLAGLGAGRMQVVDHWRGVLSQARELASSAAFEGTFASASGSPLVLEGSCEAALLFGSASPTIEEHDALALARLLLDHYRPDAPDGLADLVSEEVPNPGIPPWEHGYDLAEAVLEEVGNELLGDQTDIEGFLRSRDISLNQIELSDRQVRAISFASPNHAPTIALNTSSRFFESLAARRFTLAHELCHLLFDRSRGARLAVASGPWAPKVIEQRANAFAAMLLMPPDLLATGISETEGALGSPEAVESLASRMGVGVVALLEHAHNMGLIDESARDDLRLAFNRIR
jgi:Zn-dependent peptidase ImmA (M78 family)